MRSPLTAAGVAEALAGLTGWSGDTAAIKRTVRFPTFLDGIAAVDEVAAEAERRDHHPDIDIRWRAVRFVLTTHDRGGVTGWDVELAAYIDAVAAAHGGT